MIMEGGVGTKDYSISLCL